jgi:hypothetical protein
MREVLMILLGFVAILTLIWFVSAPELRYGHQPVPTTRSY